MSAWGSMLANLDVERPRRRPVGGDFAANVDRLRRLSGALQAGDADAQWLGDALMSWLRDGGDLVERLGVKACPGSRSAQAHVLQELQDAALLCLSVAAGGDARALAVLRDEASCPDRFVDLLLEARALKVPTSRAAFTRARSRRDASRAA